MLDATKNFVKDVEEFEEQIFDFADTKGIINMSEKEFSAMKMAMKLVDDYNEIIMRYAEIIENQNQKINEILNTVKRIENKVRA